MESPVDPKADQLPDSSRLLWHALWVTGEHVPTGVRTFGDYHLIDLVAEGGMAELWRARAYGAAGFERILCLKILKEDLAANSVVTRLFLDEARVMARLNHANIVQVYGVGEVADRPYLEMEYVHGIDLRRLIGMAEAAGIGRLPLHLSLRIGSEVLCALQFAHEAAENGRHLELVHCDVSPHNILLSAYGEVKITDFGIARAVFQSPTLHAVRRGKLPYMSPEQLDGGQLDGRTDVYSLGVVLYELTTGIRLFHDMDPEMTMDRIHEGRIPDPTSLNSEISPRMGEILNTMLARISDRYPSARAAADDLDIVANAEGLRCANSEISNFIHECASAAQ